MAFYSFISVLFTCFQNYAANWQKSRNYSRLSLSPDCGNYELDKLKAIFLAKNSMPGHCVALSGRDVLVAVLSVTLFGRNGSMDKQSSDREISQQV